MKDMIKNEVAMESTEVAPVETEYVSTEPDTNDSKVSKAVVFGIGAAATCAALAGAAMVGAVKKLKRYNTVRVLGELEKEGWYFEPPMGATEDNVDDSNESDENPDADE